MSTMPMTPSETRLHGHDTLVAEVVDHLDVLYRMALRLTRRPPARHHCPASRFHLPTASQVREKPKVCAKVEHQRSTDN